MARGTLDIPRRPVTIYLVPSRVPVKRKTSNFEPRTTTACGSKNCDFAVPHSSAQLFAQTGPCADPSGRASLRSFSRQLRRGRNMALNAHAFGFPQLLVAAFLAVVYDRPPRALPWPAKPPQPMPGTARFNRPARSAERNKEA